MYLWMNFKAYLQTQCLFADIMEKSKKSAKTSQKKIVGLHRSGSSLGAISKRLKVTRQSVETIVRQYQYTMGPHRHHTAQEGDAFSLLEMNVL
jgi:transposase